MRACILLQLYTVLFSLIHFKESTLCPCDPCFIFLTSSEVTCDTENPFCKEAGIANRSKTQKVSLLAKKVYSCFFSDGLLWKLFIIVSDLLHHAGRWGLLKETERLAPLIRMVHLLVPQDFPLLHYLQTNPCLVCVAEWMFGSHSPLHV